jgi:DNA polymerase-3 subunit gamma/tau
VSYTVLAVKWRPKRFAELVGQAHVVQALTNSLAQERLHHAYLFSGTRGVGKTTVARILAKALNCTNGVVAEPCGECAACTAIDAGRFVDLIEVDAASRTRVDDTRELLDNVQYAPTHGRYKVYLIDEVHMLSNHSFNALLKTLEEPPPHVKFLLATTDPQKLPITVLSRCLQFHLKKLTTAQIVEQLTKICEAEGIAAEANALQAIARAADGSVRDALSLLDQGIAFGGGKIEAEQIHAMLGTIDRGQVLKILAALAEEDGGALIQACDQLDELAADFGLALDDIMHALQQVAVIQLVAGKRIEEDHEALAPFAERLSPEDVQLYYQIALNGRRDLNYCRDARMGFEMTLLRMLAFRPDEAGTSVGAQSTARPQSDKSNPRGAAPARPRNEHAGRAVPARGAPAEPVAAEAKNKAPRRGADAPKPAPARGEKAKLEVVSSNVAPVNRESSDQWQQMLAGADLRGMARQLADNCEIGRYAGDRLELVLAEDKQHLLTDQVRKRLEGELGRYLDTELHVSITAGKPPRSTPAEIRLANENQRMRRARESVEQDANVRAMQSAFDAVVEPDSIQPLDDSSK